MAETTYERMKRIEKERREQLIGLSGGSVRRTAPTKTAAEAMQELEDLGLLPAPLTKAPVRERQEAPLGSDVNIYAALTGAPPSRRENQEAIADVLRHRSRVGEMAALSGLPSLQSFGQGLMQESEGRAKQFQDMRAKEIDDERTQAYQDAQLASMEDARLESQRGNTINYLNNAIRASMETEGGGGLSAKDLKPSALNNDDKKQLKEFATTASSVKPLRGILDGTTKLSNGQPVDFGSEGLVGAAGRGIQKLGSRYGLETENSRVLSQAFADFERLWSIAKRHEAFGATLTANEKSSWATVAPSFLWSPERLRTALKIIDEVNAAEADRFATGLVEDGKDPDAIGRMLGIHPESMGDPRGGGAPATEESEEEEYARLKAEGL